MCEESVHDCVFGDGEAGTMYCEKCKNWMCEECFEEHECQA